MDHNSKNHTEAEESLLNTLTESGIDAGALRDAIKIAPREINKIIYEIKARQKKVIGPESFDNHRLKPVLDKLKSAIETRGVTLLEHINSGKKKFAPIFKVDLSMQDISELGRLLQIQVNYPGDPVSADESTKYVEIITKEGYQMQAWLKLPYRFVTIVLSNEAKHLYTRPNPFT